MTGSGRRACAGLLAAALLAAAPAAQAVLTIEVTKGVEAAIAVAVVPFELQGVSAATANLPAAIIEADLDGSGKFAAVPRGDFISRPHEARAVQYKDWRLIKAEALVVGRVIKTGEDRFEVRFQLVDVFRERVLAGQKFVVPGVRLRKVAHQISDIIYETLTGTPGAFDTRIAFVTVHGKAPRRRYLLRVADADGHNAKTILESGQPILSPAWSPDGGKLAYVSFEKNRSMIYIQHTRSAERQLVAGHDGINGAPAWSPDGRKLAYVSFEKNRSMIYIQELRRAERQLVAGHDGINGAPAWSPDGRHLALTLSKDGNPDIYIYDLATRSLRRLTRHYAIDTEPAWSPDGATIAFTSGRSGTPQIYRVAAAGGAAQAVTLRKRHGKYNANANYSHDGKSIALVTQRGSGYRVALYSAQDRSVTALTRTDHDESPTFAPNGEMIMYATQSGGAHILAAVSPDGRVRQIIRLQNESGQVREPAWSPFNRKR